MLIHDQDETHVDVSDISDAIEGKPRHAEVYVQNDLGEYITVTGVEFVDDALMIYTTESAINVKEGKGD